MGQDRTAQFTADPHGFLATTPLLVSVPPDHACQGTTSFTIRERDDWVNVGVGGPALACELVLGGAHETPAYWCPYRENEATFLAVGAEASFTFTPAMNGCTFAIARPNGMWTVSHSNAAAMGMGLFDAGLSRAEAAQAQKNRQALGAMVALEADDAVVLHSCSGEATTVVGIREQDGRWVFVRQVIECDDVDRHTFKVTIRIRSVDTTPAPT